MQVISGCIIMWCTSSYRAWWAVSGAMNGDRTGDETGLVSVSPPRPQTKIMPRVFCVSCCANFEFRVMQTAAEAGTVDPTQDTPWTALAFSPPQQASPHE